MTRVLVTGGAGAVGSNLVTALLRDGHDVIVLDDLSSGHRWLVPEGAHLVEGSVTSRDTLDRAFRHSPEFVFHLAALFANQNSVEHPRRDLDVNGVGTLNMLERSHHAGVEKFLFCSSSCVYGPKPSMEEADRDFLPETPYAFTKLLGEHYAEFWCRHHGLDVVTVRPFNVFGPGELPGQYRNVIPNFFDIALRGEPLPITGTGDETRDFTYVDDVVDGMKRAMFSQTEPGEVFNLGSGRETRIIDLAERINDLVGNPAGLRFLPRRAWDHVPRRVASIERARSRLGYEPVTALDAGLERTFDWLRELRG